jgi:hypothetical protein
LILQTEQIQHSFRLVEDQEREAVEAVVQADQGRKMQVLAVVAEVQDQQVVLSLSIQKNSLIQALSRQMVVLVVMVAQVRMDRVVLQVQVAEAEAELVEMEDPEASSLFYTINLLIQGL